MLFFLSLSLKPIKTQINFEYFLGKNVLMVLKF